MKKTSLAFILIHMLYPAGALKALEKNASKPCFFSKARNMLAGKKKLSTASIQEKEYYLAKKYRPFIKEYETVNFQSLSEYSQKSVLRGQKRLTSLKINPFMLPKKRTFLFFQNYLPKTLKTLNFSLKNSSECSKISALKNLSSLEIQEAFLPKETLILKKNLKKLRLLKDLAVDFIARPTNDYTAFSQYVKQQATREQNCVLTLKVGPFMENFMDYFREFDTKETDFINTLQSITQSTSWKLNLNVSYFGVDYYIDPTYFYVNSLNIGPMKCKNEEISSTLPSYDPHRLERLTSLNLERDDMVIRPSLLKQLAVLPLKNLAFFKITLLYNMEREEEIDPSLSTAPWPSLEWVSLTSEQKSTSSFANIKYEHFNSAACGLLFNHHFKHLHTLLVSLEILKKCMKIIPMPISITTTLPAKSIEKAAQTTVSFNIKDGFKEFIHMLKFAYPKLSTLKILDDEGREIDKEILISQFEKGIFDRIKEYICLSRKSNTH